MQASIIFGLIVFLFMVSSLSITRSVMFSRKEKQSSLDHAARRQAIKELLLISEPTMKTIDKYQQAYMNWKSKQKLDTYMDTFKKEKTEI